MRAVLCLLGLVVGACGAGQESATTTSDPFAYCAAVTTADRPGAAYVGAPVPDPVAEALREAVGAPQDVPLARFKKTLSWRCMDGRVYGCTVGANLPCQAKAETSRTPSEGVRDYCRANPDAPFIPAYVTGHATVYEWRCTGGKGEIVKEIATPDARGYLSDIWYPLTRPE